MRLAQPRPDAPCGAVRLSADGPPGPAAHAEELDDDDRRPRRRRRLEEAQAGMDEDEDLVGGQLAGQRLAGRQLPGRGPLRLGFYISLATLR